MNFGRYPGPIPEGKTDLVVVNWGTVTILEFWRPGDSEPVMSCGIEIDELETIIAYLTEGHQKAKAVYATLRGS